MRCGEGAGLVHYGVTGLRFPFLQGEGGLGVMCHLCQPFWSTVQCGKKRKAACPQLCPAHRMLCTAQSKPTSSPSRGEMSHCERRNGGGGGWQNLKKHCPQGRGGGGGWGTPALCTQIGADTSLGCRDPWGTSMWGRAQRGQLLFGGALASCVS